MERVALDRLDLPAEPASVGEARPFVLRLIDGAVDDELVDAMLTLATPPAALAYRRWYLEELTQQLDGLPPRPWSGT